MLERILRSEFYRTSYWNIGGCQFFTDAKSLVRLLNNISEHNRMSALAGVLFALLAGTAATYGQAKFQSAATGNWNATSTWTLVSGSDADGVPDADDSVEVINGHTVTVNVASACYDLTVTSGVVVVPNRDFTVGGTTTLYGELRFTSTTGTKSFQDVIINGGGYWNSASAETYAIGGSLTMAGGKIDGSATGVHNVAGDFIVASGIDTLGRATITVSGSTYVSSTLQVTNTTGTKNFQTVNINSGGAWTSAVAETYTIAGDLTMSGGMIDGTATGIFNVSGNFDILSGSSTLGQATITATDTTHVDGALNITSATGTKTFIGPVLISSVGAWDNSSGNSAIVMRNGLTNDGTFTSGSGTYTFNTNSQALNGSSGLTFAGNLAITGAITVTNNTTATIGGSLTGTVGGSTWLNAANSTLNIAGALLSTGTLTATANPNTVNYNGSADQTIKGTTYHNLNVSNTGATATFGASTTVNNNFTISSGTATIGAFTLLVSNTTSITGTLNITSTTGTKTFNDLFVNSGGLFNNSANEAVTINGNIQNDGIVTAGTGIYTLAGTSKTISGVTATTIASISVTGSYTNTGTFTVSTAMTGAGSFANGTGASLRIGASVANFTVTTLTASANGNTVDYNALGAQTIRVPAGSTYHHLTASGFGAKTAGGALTVNGDFTIAGFATFDGGTSLAHNFLGNWTVSTAAATPFAFTTSSTINFNEPTTPAATSLGGTSTSTIAFNNINLNNTSDFSSSLKLSSSGTLTVGSGVTFTPSDTVVVSGTGTLTGSGTVKVTRTNATADFLTQYSIANRTLTNLTVDFEAAGSQSVNALNYFNLIIRGARGTSNITFPAGTVGISGAFSALATFTSGGYVVAGSTVNYNGTSAQVITAFNYENLTSSSTGLRTLESTGTIGIAGTFTPGTNSYTIAGSTVDYNGSGAQNVAVFDYDNFALRTSGTKTFGSGITRIAGTFNMSGSATADAVANSSTIEYSGTSAQATPSIAYSGLTVNNASGIQITGDITVSGTLTFTSGTLTTNANKVSVTSTGSVSRTSGHVVGNLEKYIPSGTPSPTFEVGSSTSYSPVALVFASVTTPGTLIVQTVSTDHPQILTSGIEASKSVNRYWAMNASGLAFTTYDATFNFVPGDVDAGANTAAFIVDRYSGGLWNQPTVGTRTATSTQATGLAGFGDFQIGEPATGVLKTWDGGAGTNNWGDANNWSPDGVPGSSDNVSLTGADTISIDVAAVCNSITLNNSSLLVTIQSGNSLSASGDFSLVSGTLNTEGTFPSVTGTLSITGGTVGYTNGNQTVLALNYYHLNLSGGGTKTFATGTTRIAGDFTASGATSDATTNSTTIEFNGSGAQSVAAVNYYNLIFSNAGVKTLASGSTGVANSFTVSGAASANATTNSTTIVYNGSGAQNINQIDYHHLSLSNAGTKTFASGTTKIAGNFVVTGSASADATTNSPTIEFNGSGAQAVAASNYHSLTLSTAGVKTFASGSTGIANSFTVTGSASADATINSSTLVYNGTVDQNLPQIDYHHLVLTNSGTKTFGTGTTKIAGNFTISGSAIGNTTTNGATVEFNGTVSQNTPSMTYVGLTVNNSAGIVLTGDATVTTTITFTTGNITTGSNKITVNIATSVLRTSGHIVGNFEKQIPTAFGGDTRTFEVGDATTYTPVTVVFASVITGGYLTVSTSMGDHPQILTSGIDGAKSVNRYWTLTNNGIVFDNYNATFNFVSGDIDAGANTANFIISRFSGGSWNTTTIGTRTSTSTQATGLTAFGDFQVGEAGTAATTWDGGAGSNNWGDPANWSPNGVPTSSTNVSLSGAFTINIDVAANCNSITLNNSGLTLNVLSGNSITVAGNLSIINGTMNIEDAFPSVGGTTTLSGGTVAYTGTGFQTVTALAYNHLSVSGAPDTSVHKIVAGDITVNGTLNVAANNTLDMQNYSILSLGAGSNLGKVMWQGSNSFVITGAGTTEFYGDLSATVVPGTYGNVLFTGSGTKTISGAVIATGGASASEGVTVMNNLTITNSGSLTVTGMDLNNLGSITNNGVISVNP